MGLVYLAIIVVISLIGAMVLVVVAARMDRRSRGGREQ